MEDVGLFHRDWRSAYAYGYGHSHTDANTNSNQSTNPDQHTQPDAHVYADGDAISNPLANSKQDSDADTQPKPLGEDYQHNQLDSVGTL